jgi:hypothetical protein
MTGGHHSAHIRWSVAQERAGLPDISRTIDPAWFLDSGPGSEEGWSLMCEFADPPRVQGNPSSARVRFLVESAPADRLRPGVRLVMFERGTGERAEVEILE